MASLSDIALIDPENGIMHYQGLITFCDEFTAKVKHSCKQSRPLVFALCSNTIGGIAGYVASVHAHIVVALLSDDIGIEQFNDLVTAYAPDLIWAPKHRTDIIGNEIRAFEAFGYVLINTHLDSSMPLHNDLALLMTTSGSTGSPKFVRQSYANLRSNTKSIISYLDIDEHERAITSLPLEYVYGLSVVNSHLQAGASLVLTEDGVCQKEFWNLIHRYGVTSMAGVPYTYELLYRLRIDRMDLPSLTTFTQAGGHLAPMLQTFYGTYAQHTGRRFFIMYGQAEATARMAYLPPDACLDKIGSMGVAIPGGHFELIDDEEKRIDKNDTEGELIYYGENVCMGYAICCADLQKADENKGVLHTGDEAMRDADGFYRIVGRKKRFIKLCGKRVSLESVDDMLRARFPDVDCVSGGDDTQLVIFVASPCNTSLMKHSLAELLRMNKKLITIHRVATIPRNEAGKIRYSALKAFLDDQSCCS
ncbi:MAG: AMP-binding protein [Eggerthellaceae bacterium]|jgi:acyl-coenzyme A synthetase/AMP-(fatty) acid ligase|nr:AMP-binding protein [Eggerthellaceae bacterium]MCH4220741.1 AMP-binding protein [Eggerthellaceae bacterium]